MCVAAVAAAGLGCSGGGGPGEQATATTTTTPTTTPPPPTEGGVPGTLPPMPDRWQLLPEAPLGPRADALLVWTGEEVLVVGGVSQVRCPPNADCARADPPLDDGAAFDLVDRSWRTIADVPAAHVRRSDPAAAVDGLAYVLTAGSEADRATGARRPVLLRYDPGADAWDTLDLPGGVTTGYLLAAVPGGLVAHPSSDEHGEAPDFLYDPGEDEWRELPDDPLPATFDRTVVGTDDGFVLVAREIADLRLPDPELSSAAALATFDPVAGTWERLADSVAVGPGGLFHEQGELVNPHVSSYEGAGDTWSAVGGGTLDLATGATTALPRPPQLGDPTVGGFMWDRAEYSGTRGVVYDAAQATWARLPDLDGPAADHARSVVAAGRDAFAYGGVRWTNDTSEVLGDAWLWTPTPSAYPS